MRVVVSLSLQWAWWLRLSVLAVLLSSLGDVGCARSPLPPARAPAPQSCGNPCASLNCPSAYTCSVDAHCGASCQPERVGNKLF